MWSILVFGIVPAFIALSVLFFFFVWFIRFCCIKHIEIFNRIEILMWAKKEYGKFDGMAQDKTNANKNQIFA